MALHLMQFAKYATSNVAHQIKMCALVRISHGMAVPYTNTRTTPRAQAVYFGAGDFNYSPYGDGARRTFSGLSSVSRELGTGANTTFAPSLCQLQVRCKQTGRNAYPPPPVTSALVPNHWKRKPIIPAFRNSTNCLLKPNSQKKFNRSQKGFGAPQENPRGIKQRKDPCLKEHTSAKPRDQSTGKPSKKAKKSGAVETDSKMSGEKINDKTNHGLTVNKKRSGLTHITGKEKSSQPEVFKDKSQGPNAKTELKVTNLSKGVINPISSIAKEMNEWLNAVKEHLTHIEEADETGARMSAKRSPKKSKSAMGSEQRSGNNKLLNKSLTVSPNDSNSTSQMIQSKAKCNINSEVNPTTDAITSSQFVEPPRAIKGDTARVSLDSNPNSNNKITTSSKAGLTKDLEKINHEISRLRRERGQERDSLRPNRPKTEEKHKDSEGLLEIRPTYVENITNEADIVPKKSGPLAGARVNFSSKEATQPAESGKLSKTYKTAPTKSASMPNIKDVHWKVQKAPCNPPRASAIQHQENGFILLDRTMNSNTDSKSYEETGGKQGVSVTCSNKGSPVQGGSRDTTQDTSEGMENGFILLESVEKLDSQSKASKLMDCHETPQPLQKMTSKENNIVLANNNLHEATKRYKKMLKEDSVTVPGPLKNSEANTEKFFVVDDGIFGSVATQRGTQPGKESKEMSLTSASKVQNSNSATNGERTSQSNTTARRFEDSNTDSSTSHRSKLFQEKLNEMEAVKKPLSAGLGKTPPRVPINSPLANASQNSRLFHPTDTGFGRDFEHIVRETQQLIEETEAAMRLAKKHSAFNRRHNKSDVKPSNQIDTKDTYKDQRDSDIFTSTSSHQSRYYGNSAPVRNKSPMANVPDPTSETRSKTVFRQSSPTSIGLKRKSTEPKLFIKPEEISKKNKRSTAAASSEDFSHRYSPIIKRIGQSRLGRIRGDEVTDSQLIYDSDFRDIGDHELWSRLLKAKMAEYQKPQSAPTVRQPALKNEVQDARTKSTVNVPKRVTTTSWRDSPATTFLNENRSLETVETRNDLKSGSMFKLKQKQTKDRNRDLNRASSDSSLSSLKDHFYNPAKSRANPWLLKELQEQWARDFKENYLKAQKSKLLKSKYATESTKPPVKNENNELNLDNTKSLHRNTKITKSEKSKSSARGPATTPSPVQEVKPSSNVKPTPIVNCSPQNATTSTDQQSNQEIEAITNHPTTEDTLDSSGAIGTVFKSYSTEIEADAELDPFQEWIQSREKHVAKTMAQQIQESQSVFCEASPAVNKIHRDNTGTVSKSRAEKLQSIKDSLIQKDSPEMYLNTRLKKGSSFATEKERKSSSVNAKKQTSHTAREKSPDTKGNYASSTSKYQTNTDIQTSPSSKTSETPPRHTVKRRYEPSYKDIFSGDKSFIGNLDGIATMEATRVEISRSPPTASKSSLKKNSSPRGESKRVSFQNPLTVDSDGSRDKHYEVSSTKSASRLWEQCKTTESREADNARTTACDGNDLEAGTTLSWGKRRVRTTPTQTVSSHPWEYSTAGECDTQKSGSLDPEESPKVEDIPESDVREILAAQRDQEMMEARKALIKSYQENLENYKASLAKYPAFERYKERMRRAREGGATGSGAKGRGAEPE